MDWEPSRFPLLLSSHMFLSGAVLPELVVALTTAHAWPRPGSLHPTADSSHTSPAVKPRLNQGLCLCYSYQLFWK